MNTEDFKREELLFKYTRAYDRGDFEGMMEVLTLAETDSKLEQMIVETHEAFAEDEPQMSQEQQEWFHERISALLKKREGTL